MSRGTFPLNESRVLTTNPDGHALYLDAADTSLTPVILTRRMYEPGTTRLMRRLVRSGSRVVEVGANIGWYTLLCAERVGPTGSVHSFEPNPRTFEILHTNVFINGLWDRCQLEQRALGRSPGQAMLRVPGTYSAGSNLRPSDPGALAWMHQNEIEVTVDVATLDDALGDNVHCDLLKIDVEGFEAEVFAGGEKFFAANPRLKVIMEFTPAQHGVAMLDWMRSDGRQIHEIDRFGRTHRTADPMRLMDRPSLDVLLTR